MILLLILATTKSLLIFNTSGRNNELFCASVLSLENLSVKGFEAWKTQAEKKHMTELQEVEIKHAQELEQLRSFQRNQDTEWLNQCAVIEEKYSDEIRQLKEKLEASHVERLKMEEDYVEKLAKAQAFYEQELKALQQSETSSFEGELNALRVQQEKLRNDFSAQERELRKQIDSLVRQLADAEDLADALKQENEKLTQEMKSKDSSAESTVQQVDLIRCGFFYLHDLLFHVRVH